MLKGVVMNPSFYVDYADQQYVSGFNLAQAHALAQAQARAQVQAQAYAQAYAQAVAQAQYNRALDEAIYGSDEFRMYAYKIKRCTRMRPHDWTECPYAHRNEKAQRRDPRKYPYSAIACPAFRNGRCHKGDNCEYAHGVFEYWLHPGRYRTRPCNAGKSCTRRVCFFAHKHDQLRCPESKYKFCHFANKHGRMMPTRTMMMNSVDPQLMMMMNGGDQNQVMMMEYPAVGVEGSTSMKAHCVEPSPEPPHELEGVTLLLKSLEKLKMREDELKAREMKMKMKMKNTADTNVGSGNDVADLDLPHLDWISELVK